MVTIYHGMIVTFSLTSSDLVGMSVRLPGKSSRVIAFDIITRFLKL